MKRIWCLVIAAVMTLCGTWASAEMDYSLAEKFQRQMQSGSGMSGTVMLTAEGVGPLDTALQGLTGAEIQVRALRNENDQHIAFYIAGEGENRLGLTELLKQEDTWYFRSDLLPGEDVWQMPDAFQTAETLHSVPEGGNPSIMPALVRAFQMSESKRKTILDPAIAKLSGWLEIWLADFAAVSVVRKLENGTSGVDMMYNIPMSEIRKEIVALIKALIRDSDGQALLNAIFTAEEAELYANTYLDYYYLDAMESLDNDYDVVYTRTVTTLGQTVASSLEMPLDESRTGFQALSIDDNGGLISIIARGDERLLALQMPRSMDFNEIDAASIWVYYKPSESDVEKNQMLAPIAVRLDVAHEHELTEDEDNRIHLTDTWTLTGTHDLSRLPVGEKAADYPPQEPISGQLKLHYSSRNAQASPTSLEVVGSLKQGATTNIGVTANMKTVAPWTYEAFTTDEAREIMSLDDIGRAVLFAEWLTSAGELIAQVKEAAPAPEATEEPEGTEETEESAEAEATEETAEETEETVETEETTDETAVTEETEPEETAEVETKTETAEVAPETETAAETTETTDTEETVEETENAEPTKEPINEDEADG